MNDPEKNCARFYRQPGLACVHYMAALLNFTVCSAKVSRYDHSTRTAAVLAAVLPMSVCTRCGATFSCALAERRGEPCWCAALPAAAAVPLPQDAAGCWCRACLQSHIAELAHAQAQRQR